MATLVRFFIQNDEPKEVFAVFPQLNYNKHLYTSTLKVGYAHIGQHTAISPEYVNTCNPATPEQYNDLKVELESIGYELKVCKQ